MKVIVLLAFLVLPVGAYALERPDVGKDVLRHHSLIMDKITSDDGERLSSLVDTIVAVKGANPNGSCGGLNYHRVLYAFKKPMRDLRIPAIGPSKDMAGPHPGTDLSFETKVSRPGMQFHTFRGEPTEGQLATLADRFGVDVELLAEFGDRLVEVDIDYDWRHISNPNCRVRSFAGSVIHKLVPIPRLLSETADRRLERRLALFSHGFR